MQLKDEAQVYLYTAVFGPLAEHPVDERCHFATAQQTRAPCLPQWTSD